MKRIFSYLLIFSAAALQAQTARTINLEDCYTLARSNYPLLKERGLIQQTKEFTVKNAWRGYIPVINASGQATYQSETTNFGDVFGGIPPTSPFYQAFKEIHFPTYSKDQYRLTGEVNQTVFDGLAGKFKKENAVVQAEVQEQSLEVNLYALRQRVNQVYFGILLIDEELLLNAVQQQDVQNGIDRTQALVNNGTAYRSAVDELKAQLLQVKQNSVDLAATRRGYMMVLGLLTGQQLDENTVLAKPEAPDLNDDIKRPELRLYEVQKKTYDVQSRQLNTGLMPQLNAYFDGSYGRPTLNTVSNDFGAFWIAGIRFNWSIAALYTLKNNRRVLALSQKDLDLQKQTFLFNTQISAAQEDEDIRKYNELVANDQQIVDLRASVTRASDAQLKNGVITGHDYIAQVDAEAQARLNLILHQVQLLQAQYNHKNTTGN